MTAVQTATLPVTIDDETARITLLDREQADAFYDRIRAEVANFVPDTSTATGRKAIASEAFRVTKAKTAIDKARKGLTEEWRNKTKLVNEAGKHIVARLDSLAAEVRDPLTRWEEAESERIAECNAVIAELLDAARIHADDTAELVRARGMMVWKTELDAEKFGELLPEAETAKQQAVLALKDALARLTKEEADRAELEKLRAEKAERDRIEAEQAAAAEAERQRIAAEQLAEQQRLAAQKAEAERIERAKEQAAAEALRAAEQAHADALAAERRRAEEAEQAVRERAASEQRAAAEQAARAADAEHRRTIKNAAKDAIMACGVTEDAARTIITTIIAGKIPHVRLEF